MAPAADICVVLLEWLPVFLISSPFVNSSSSTERPYHASPSYYLFNLFNACMAYDYLFYSLGYNPLLLLLALLLGLFHFLPLGALSGWSLGPIDAIFLS